MSDFVERVLQNMVELQELAEQEPMDIEMTILEAHYYNSIDEIHFNFDIEVVNENDEDEINEEIFDEVKYNFLSADICFDISDTLGSDGNLLFPDAGKATFTFENNSCAIIDGIDYDAKLENSEIFMQYVIPALEEYIKMGSMFVVR